MNLFETAMRYTAAGVAVIPIWRDARKNPHLSSVLEFTERLPTADEWQRWARQWPVCNLGLITGYWRNWIALDFDDQAAYQAWTDQAGRPARGQTWTVATARGYHVWFESQDDPGSSRKYLHPAGHEVLIRARGGYAIVPPSVHHSGARYTTVHKVPPLEIDSIEAYLDGWKECARRLPARPAETTIPNLSGRVRIEDLIPIPDRARPNGRGAYQVFCPFHDDGRPSAWVNVSSQRFGCNACWPGLWFDVVNVYALLKGIDNRQAYKALVDGDKKTAGASDPKSCPHNEVKK